MGVLTATKKIALLLIALLFFGIESFAAPAATLTADVSSGFPPLNVTFSGGCTDSNAEATIVSCLIDFGDGNSGIDFNTVSGTHPYCGFTAYTATLAALNDLGESHSATVQITGQNNSPTASLGAAPLSGLAPLTVTFTGSCSDADGSADIAACRISFGDGSQAVDLNVFSGTYTYNTAGTFAATLTATDAQAATGSDSKSIAVSATAAPSIANKKPANGSYTTMVRPTVSFDVKGSASGVDISRLALFADGSIVTPTTIAFGNNYFVSWQYGSDLSNGHNAKIGARAFDNSGNYSDANWAFTIDTSGPTSVSISYGSGWTNNETPSFSLSASDNSGSGMGSGAEMKLSCDNSNWTGGISYGTSYSSFNITTGPGCSTSNGTKTIYAQFKDAIGNWNTSSASTTVNYDNSTPDKPGTPSASAGNGQVSLSWSSVSDAGSAGIDTYRIYVNGSYYTSTTGTSTTVSNLTNGSSYGFRVSAKDRAGNEGEQSNSVSATPRSGGSSSNDTTVPELYWELPSNNATVSGTVLLKVQAYDNESGLRFVSFRVDNNPIGTDYTSVGERYALDWNSMAVVDGTHTLKAMAKSFSDDEEDNSRTREITVTVRNGITSLPGEEDKEMQDAEAALAVADDAKEQAAEMLSGLRAEGFEPSESSMNLLNDADDALQEAQDYFDGEDYGNALGKAKEAAGLFDDFTGLFSVDDFGSAVGYVYNKEHLGVLLGGMGFSSQLSAEAQEMAEEISVGRSLSVKQITEGEQSVYIATVKITVKNDSDGEKEFKVIEIIPKEFAENASMISGSGFTVLAQDPAIEWDMVLAAGEEKEIAYLLKDSLSREKAEELLNAGSLEKFAVPPVLFKQETVVPESVFSQQAQPAGFFGLGTAELTGFAAVVIIIVAAALLLFNYLQGRNSNGNGALANAGGEKMGLFDSLKGKKKEEPKKKRWAYKE